jgi:hypothetical protein
VGLDYEIVIGLFGGGDLGFSEFSLWSAMKPAGTDKPHNTLCTAKATTMKTPTLFAAIALTLAASGAAMAQEATYDYPQATASHNARADVVNSLRQAQAEGRQNSGEAQHTLPTRVVSTVTRAEVRAQTLAAIASGEVAELNRSHHNGFDTVVYTGPAATRVASK